MIKEMNSYHHDNKLNNFCNENIYNSEFFYDFRSLASIYRFLKPKSRL